MVIITDSSGSHMFNPEHVVHVVVDSDDSARVDLVTGKSVELFGDGCGEQAQEFFAC